MTAKRTISLTDHADDFARQLVESGHFASLSAVVQHGLRLVEQEQAEHQARLDAIRGDLAERAAEPAISTEEMDRRLDAWRAQRDAQDTDDLA